MNLRMIREGSELGQSLESQNFPFQRAYFRLAAQARVR